MIKKIKVSSVIDTLALSGLPEGDPERTETHPEASVECSGGEYKIVYTEPTEGGEVRTEIKIKEGNVTVRRTGAIRSEMHFAEGVSHKSLYSIPPYSFDAEIYTVKVRDRLESDGRLDILYRMEIGGESRRVRMTVQL